MQLLLCMKQSEPQKQGQTQRVHHELADGCSRLASVRLARPHAQGSSTHLTPLPSHHPDLPTLHHGICAKFNLSVQKIIVPECSARACPCSGQDNTLAGQTTAESNTHQLTPKQSCMTPKWHHTSALQARSGSTESFATTPKCCLSTKECLHSIPAFGSTDQSQQGISVQARGPGMGRVLLSESGSQL